jgi:hypothetical protein
LEDWQQAFLDSLIGDEDGFARIAFERLSTDRQPAKLALRIDNVVSLTITRDLRTGFVEGKGGKKWRVSHSNQFGLSRRELESFEGQVRRIAEKTSPLSLFPVRHR